LIEGKEREHRGRTARAHRKVTFRSLVARCGLTHPIGKIGLLTTFEKREGGGVEDEGVSALCDGREKVFSGRGTGVGWGEADREDAEVLSRGEPIEKWA
jgi:hypothetical protein